MSWGTDLWDQYDNLGAHTQKGLEFVEKFGHFLKERCAIEQEYASKLKRLVKNNQPKKKEEDDYQFTHTKAFLSMIKEVHDMASQHEVIAEALNSIGTKDVTTLMQEVKHERKKCLKEGAELQKQLGVSIQLSEAAKKQYEKQHREAEKSVENYKRADADINLSRAEVEKQRVISQQKSQQLDEAKLDYGAQLQKTNQLQEDHYTKMMPSLYQQLQGMDEKRITRLQDLIRQCARLEDNVIPILKQCINGMESAANSISPSQDSSMVIERYKSGFQPPESIPFEDLGNVSEDREPRDRSEKPISRAAGGSFRRWKGSKTDLTPKTGPAKSEGKGTTSGKKKKRGALQYIFGNAKGDEPKEDFSHLTPAQQKKKLSQKIDAIKATIAKETLERDGMLKIKDVYEQNPAMGDPQAAAKRLEENGQKLDQLKQELCKFEGYLLTAEGAPGTPRMDNGGSTPRRPSKDVPAPREPQLRDSLSDEGGNMSRSPSNVSVQSGHQQSASHIPVDDSAQAQKASPDSGLGNHLNVPMAGDDSFDEDDVPYPPMGSAKAVYPFTAENPGSISMGPDEQFHVIERDVSDGWTLVRRMDNSEEGYVPTTYIEIQWF